MSQSNGTASERPMAQGADGTEPPAGAMDSAPTRSVGVGDSAPTRSVGVEDQAPTRSVGVGDQAPTRSVGVGDQAPTRSVGVEDQAPTRSVGVGGATAAVVPAEEATMAAEEVTPWGRIAGIVVGVAALLAVVVTAFSWPAVNSGPHEVPIAVAAPAPVAQALTQQLQSAAGEDAFEVTTVTDPAAAEQAIMDREVYGAIVIGPNGGEVLTASGASPAIAQSLAQIAANAPEQVGGPLPVTDLAPLPQDDPRGAGLGSAVLPLVIGGLISGAVSGLVVMGRGRQLVTLAALAVAGGLALTGVVQGWLGGLPGSYLANSGVLALGIAAVGAVVLGLVRHVGVAGVGLTALVMVLLGSPLSGAQSAPEMLPAGWGSFGQLLPPGAAATALRSVAWFDGAGSGPSFLVLGCWLLVGLVLCFLPARSGRRAH